MVVQLFVDKEDKVWEFFVPNQLPQGQLRSSVVGAPKVVIETKVELVGQECLGVLFPLLVDVHDALLEIVGAVLVLEVK